MGVASSIRPEPGQSTFFVDRRRLYGAGESSIVMGLKNDLASQNLNSFVVGDDQLETDGKKADKESQYNDDSILGKTQTTMTDGTLPSPSLTTSSEVAEEMSKRLQAINTAAVNGEKSLLLKLIDGNYGLLLKHNEFGRYVLSLV